MSELIDKAQKYCNHPTASKPAQAIIRDLLAENERLAAAVVERDRLLTEEDRSHMDTIIKRDYAEEVIDKLCDAVLGVAPEHRPEWSNAYGFDDAVEAVEERMARAEARLRALCEQEPVAWRWGASGHFRVSIDGRANADEWYPLIPRPSMEDFK